MNDRTGRAVTGILIAFALASAFPAGAAGFVGRAFAAGLGLGIPAVARYLWGERSRPKATPLWLLGGPILLLVLFFLDVLPVFGDMAAGRLVLPLMLLVGVFLMHDLSLTPSLLLTAGVLGTLVQGMIRDEVNWSAMDIEEAWLIAFVTLLTIAAALLERERLARRQGQVTAWTWTGVRFGLIAGWTWVALFLRKQLQFGYLFRGFGADPATEEGRIVLLAVIMACLLLAAFVFRARKGKATAAEAAAASSS